MAAMTSPVPSEPNAVAERDQAIRLRRNTSKEAAPIARIPKEAGSGVGAAGARLTLSIYA